MFENLNLGDYYTPEMKQFFEKKTNVQEYCDREGYQSFSSSHTGQDSDSSLKSGRKKLPVKDSSFEFEIIPELV